MTGPETPPGDALLAAIFDAADIMCGVFALEADDYRYVTVNPAAAAFYDKRPEDLIGRSGRELGVSEPQIEQRMAVLQACWREKRAERREYRFDHGERRGWFLGSFTPLLGGPPRVGFVLLDITRQKTAERSAEDRGRKLQIALDSADLGLWEYDLRNGDVTWDGRMRRLYDVEGGAELDLSAFAAHLHPDDQAAVRAAFDAAVAGVDGGRYQLEHRTKAGRWIRASGQVTFDGAGRPFRAVGTARDITAERAARDQQRLLVAELNHRVKNNLATVQSIAVQTARAATDLPGFIETFEGRLVALARTHDVLTATAWSAADLGEVVARETAAFGDRVSRRGAACPLTAQQALALGMIIHELSTNAAKHGALSRPGGVVDICWSRDGAATTLTWRERGGPQPGAPGTGGFGSRLMRRLAEGDLRGRLALDYAPDGLVARLEFDASESPPADGP